jgi:hypothetical protein
MSEKIARVPYRFDTSPATYDFVSWLAIVEQLRVREGVDKVVVSLIPGRRDQSDRDRAISPERYSWRTNVLIPALASLLPSCIGVTIGKDTEQQTVPYLIAPLPFGPYLRGPEYMLSLIPFNGDYLTLTVRQSWFQILCDTPSLWNELIPQFKLPVVVVPDTEAEMNGTPCRITAGRQYAAAAFDPRLRFALYKKARLNLFSANGPSSLALYSDLNAEIFGIHIPEYKTCAADHITKLGLVDGCTLQNTRIHWKGDRETILNAVEERLC